MKVKKFSDFDDDPIKAMNEFIKHVDVIDIKQSVVTSATGNFYAQYLVLYEEEK